MNVFAFAFSGTNLFAGTRLGIFHSANNGSNWVEVSSGLTNTYINVLAVSGMNLFAGTWGSGVWKRPISEMVSVHIISSDLPTEFGLGQNYPNPFNPSTIIGFSVPTGSFISLKVYDLLGKEVSILVSKFLTPGMYEINFEAGNLASGVYFYQLNTGEFVQTKKLLLQK